MAPQVLLRVDLQVLVNLLVLILQSVLLKVQVLVLLVLLLVLVQHLAKLIEGLTVLRLNLVVALVVELLMKETHLNNLTPNLLKPSQSLASKDVTPEVVKVVAELQLLANPNKRQNPSAR
tara:strand:- start:423 stop:782 length:360 start_codon:yes stop_codon:yes gene_type:complete